MSTTADAVLLLHGQPGSSRDWDALVAALGSGVRSLAVDRPGWDGEHPPTDLTGNAQAAVAMLDRSGIDRAVVGGHSLGAAVAVQLALDHPGRVAALVLVSPAANAASLTRTDLMLAAPVAGPITSAAALSGAGLALATNPLRRSAARLLGLDERYLSSAWRGLLTPSAWRAFVYEQRMLVRELPNLERRLGEISAATTVVCGAADRIVPMDAARQLAAAIPNARLEVLKGAGHLLPQRKAVRLASIITEQLTR